jgi:hypothetical protein
MQQKLSQKQKNQNRKNQMTLHSKISFYFKKRKGWTSMCGIVSGGWLGGGKIDHTVSV